MSGSDIEFETKAMTNHTCTHTMLIANLIGDLCVLGTILSAEHVLTLIIIIYFIGR